MEHTDLKQKYLQGNIEINKYLGKEITYKEYTPSIANVQGRYHQSWDWLMEAVQKINDEQQAPLAIRDLKYTITYLLSGYYGFTDFKRVPITMTLYNLWQRVVMYSMYKNNGEEPLTPEQVEFLFK